MKSDQRVIETIKKMEALKNMMVDVAYRMDALNIDALDSRVAELAGAAEILDTWIEGLRNEK
jgi:hypothetical protein